MRQTDRQTNIQTNGDRQTQTETNTTTKQTDRLKQKVTAKHVHTGRLVLKKTVYLLGQYAEYEFDQQKLIW